MVDIKYLRSVPIPDAPPFPDPNLKWMSNVVKTWDCVSRADAGILGIPFDRGVVSNRQGARFGPDGVREAFYGSTDYCVDHDVCYSDMSIVDFGNVEVDIVGYQETQKRIESVLGMLYSTGIRVLAIGGDHSTASPVIRGLCKNLMKGQKLGVIDFDSHFDIRSGWSENSGLWAREILEIEGKPIDGKNFVQIGVHGYVYSRYYREQARKYGMTAYTPLDVRKTGMEEVVKEALEIASDGTDALYLSVDIDAIDQAFAPGTNAPFPAGLYPQDLLVAVFEIARHKLIKGMDLMEIAPPLDINDMTSRLGAEILFYFLCGLKSKK